MASKFFKNIAKRLGSEAWNIGSRANRFFTNIGKFVQPIVDSPLYKKIQTGLDLLNNVYPNPFTPLISGGMGML